MSTNPRTTWRVVKERTGLSDANAKRVLTRARKRLRATLQELDGSEVRDLSSAPSKRSATSEAGQHYHAAGTRWKPAQPLLCWNRLKVEGVVTDEEWQHRTSVGQDGDVVPLHADLAEARRWARTGETIVRIRIPRDHQDKIRLDSEQFYAFPDTIPWEWCEVVEVKT